MMFPTPEQERQMLADIENVEVDWLSNYGSGKWSVTK